MLHIIAGWCNCWKYPEDIQITNVQIEHLRIDKWDYDPITLMMDKVTGMTHEVNGFAQELREIRQEQLRQRVNRDDYFITVSPD